MAARAESVCRRICQNGNWQVSNLKLQKLMYLAHMTYLGRTGEPLFNGFFEAWDFGPVEPSIYRKVRHCGSQPIPDIFTEALDFPDGSPRALAIDEICAELINFPPRDLVAITHWEGGAWAKHYEPGRFGIAIPDSDIIAEYRARVECGEPG